MRPVKNDPAEIAEMTALAAAYRGKVTRCPSGKARGHKVRPKDVAPQSRFLENPHCPTDSDDAPSPQADARQLKSAEPADFSG